MAKTLIAVIAVLLVALGLQVVGVVSMPVSKTITIASYSDISYGIWGYCDLNGRNCSSVGLGYPADADIPNQSMRVLTKLLICHVVATGCTLIMLVLAAIGFCGNRGYILALSILAVPSFLVSLLAFLVEILLFTRNLNFAGWFVLVSVILNGFVIVLLCIQHRALSDRWQGSSLESDRDDEKLINSRVYQTSIDNATTNSFDGGNNVIEPPRKQFNPQPSIRESDRDNSATSLPPTQPIPQPPRHGGPQRDPWRGGPGGGSMAASAAHAGAGTAPGMANRRARGQPQGSTSGDPPMASRTMGGYPQPPPHQTQPTNPQAGQQMSDGYRPAPIRKDTSLQQRARATNDDGFVFDSALPPAGTDIPGVEDARSSFGPGVVAIPRIRNIDTAQFDPADGEEARSGNTPSGTPHMVRAMPRDESQFGIVHYAQPGQAERQSETERESSQQYYENANGYTNYSRTREYHTHEDPAAAFRNVLPPRVSVQSTAGYQAPLPQQRQQQGTNRNLMERFMQELPPSQDYYEYHEEAPHHNLAPPHSPGGSDLSDLTSVSQRDAKKWQAAQNHASTAQRKAADRNDMVLGTNPDFALPGMKGGRKARAGHR